MKILKKVGIGILALIILILIAGLFVSKDFNYEQSIVINAPIETVWENTNSLADLDQWSPWNDLDPNMKKELTGTDGTVGAKSSWESDVENVGVGSQTIVKIDPPHTFETALKFYEPFESEAQGFVILAKEGENTKVTWKFESEMPWPFNLMKYTMNMEETLGKDFTKGLSKLEKLCK